MGSRPRTWKPSIFIGSSSEQLKVAKALATKLGRVAKPIMWDTSRSFPVGSNTLDSLVKLTTDCDYAVVVMGPDDVIRSRGKQFKVARDNAVFELGLFMGTLGMRRAFFLYERKHAPKLPSDLAGVTALVYTRTPTLASGLTAACVTIREVIESEGPCVVDVRRRVREHAHRALSELAGSAKSFDDEAAYIRRLTTELRKVESRSWFHAVCGAKNYRLPEVKKYLQANYDAARKRGIHVGRIFMKVKGRFTVAEKRAITEHRKTINMTAYEISTPNSKRIVKRYGLPQGFGFAITEHFVMIHHGLRGNNRGGTLYTSPYVIEEYHALYEELRLAAKTLDPII